MAMQQQIQRTLKNIFILSLIAAISSCGGSSSNGRAASSSSSVAADTTPNAFSFAAVVDAIPNSAYTSPAITVTGTNKMTAISITGGTYAIDGGTYTASAGTVNAAQTVTVKVTSAADPSTAASVVLTIGGVSATYTVTTIAETTAPTAQILFPPIVSMTEGNTILVRGTASDAYSIKSVKVNGVTATTSDGFANWQALVPLTDTTVPVTAPTENTITVVTEDNAGNIGTDAARVSIRQAPLTNSFPDGDNEFHSAKNLVVDKLDGRNRLLVAGSYRDVNNGSPKAVFNVDLITGKRTVFAMVETGYGIVINSASKHLYVGSDYAITDFNLADASQFQSHSGRSILEDGPMLLDTTGLTNNLVKVDSGSGVIQKINEAFTSFVVFSDAVTNKPDMLNPITSSFGITFDKNNSRYLVTDGGQKTIFAVNSVTGGRTVFSSNTVGAGENFGELDSINSLPGSISAIEIDELNHRAIVAEGRTGKIFAVNLSTGNRSLISTISLDNPENEVKDVGGVVIIDPKGYALVTNDRANRITGVVAIDLITGKRVVFSKSAKR